MKSKRGEIGEMIIWIIATVAIVFVISMFLGATSLLVASKSIPVLSWVLGTGENKINLVSGSYLLVESNDGNTLLSIPVNVNGNKILLRDIVYFDNPINDDLLSSVNSFSNKISSECYGVLYESSSNEDKVLTGGLSDSFLKEKYSYLVLGSKGKLFVYAGGCQ